MGTRSPRASGRSKAVRPRARRGSAETRAHRRTPSHRALSRALHGIHRGQASARVSSHGARAAPRSLTDSGIPVRPSSRASRWNQLLAGCPLSRGVSFALRAEALTQRSSGSKPSSELDTPTWMESLMGSHGVNGHGIAMDGMGSRGRSRTGLVPMEWAAEHRLGGNRHAPSGRVVSAEQVVRQGWSSRGSRGQARSSRAKASRGGAAQPGRAMAGKVLSGQDEAATSRTGSQGRAKASHPSQGQSCKGGDGRAVERQDVERQPRLVESRMDAYALAWERQSRIGGWRSASQG